MGRLTRESIKTVHDILALATHERPMYEDIYFKLKQYESTGLTPEEIMDGKLLTGWIPVSEQLPVGKEFELKIDGKTFYRKVLVQTTSLNMHTAHYDTDAWFAEEGNRLDVLYWMPLPKLYRPE